MSNVGGFFLHIIANNLLPIVKWYAAVRFKLKKNRFAKLHEKAKNHTMLLYIVGDLLPISCIDGGEF